MSDAQVRNILATRIITLETAILEAIDCLEDGQEELAYRLLSDVFAFDRNNRRTACFESL